MRRLPYRTQLVVAYTAIFALALVVLCAIAYASVRFTLGSSLEARLETTATAIRSVPDFHHGRLVLDGDDRRQFLQLLGDSHVNGIAVTAGGTVLGSNLQRPPAEVIDLLERGAARDGKAQGTLAVASSPVAYVAYPLVHRGHVEGYVATWESRLVDEDAARITLLSLLGSSLLMILVAIGVGRVLIDRMLRPINDLSAMMSAIEASDLSDRLAWRGPDDELGRLCAAFDRLLDRLEAAFDRERRFTADASHELRTPLSVMRAEVELALLRDRDGDAYRATLARLRSETERLEALIESLLLTARSDRGLSHAEPAAVAAIAAQAVARMQPVAVVRGIEIAQETNGEPCALVDARLLESAIVALLDNAIRYTPADGRIRVAVRGETGSAIVAVIDGGPGFSAAALSNATQRFWRDDPSRTGTGTGLGLAIVRTIVERHGGTTTLLNQPAGGAMVELRLPALPYEWPKSGDIGKTVGSSA